MVMRQVLRRLEGLVESESSPADDRSLVFLTRLLQACQRHFARAAEVVPTLMVLQPCC